MAAAASIPARPLAVVTGASSGIGRELARCCAEHGFDLVLAADEPQIEQAAAELRRSHEIDVRAVQADLATSAGVDALEAALAGRPVDALLANAGRTLGHGFFEQDFAAVRRVLDTNITGTLDLLHRVGRAMRVRGEGRILITGSIVGFIPGPFQAVYNGSKAFLDSFAAAIRNELADSGVTVTCLLPGVTETRVFERAGMQDTEIGQQKNKADPADVARDGFDAMLRGDGEIISGWTNKLQVALANVTPAPVLAALHRVLAESASGKDSERSGG